MWQVSDRIKLHVFYLEPVMQTVFVNDNEIFFSPASGMQPAKFHTSLHFYEQQPPCANLHINTPFEDEHGP